MPELSVVLPIFNERDNLRLLHERLIQVLEPLGRSFEILLIDDGSTDGSYEIEQELAAADGRVKVVRFRRNFGQTAAMAAGFDLARGRIVITMDADLQNDPVDIPRLIHEMEQGDFDIVSGWRKNRKDAFISRKLPSRIANWLISRTTSVRLRDYGCSLKAYRCEVVRELNLYGEMHRFIPALASWMGISVSEIPVEHHARKFGKSKYGISRTLRVVLDLLTVKFLLSYSTRPIQVFGKLGIWSMGAGFLVFLATLYYKFWMGLSMNRNPLLVVSVLLFMVGVQFVTMGLLGEINIRTYHESQGKPIYVIKATHNLEDENPEAGGRDQSPAPTAG